MSRRGQVSLVSRVIAATRLTAPVAQNAIVLGDIDNDSGIELAIGSNGGDLSIFKLDRNLPWRVAKGLGSISALAVGKLRNQELNSLIVITGEGDCHLFDIEQDDPETPRYEEGARARRTSFGFPRSYSEADMSELSQKGDKSSTLRDGEGRTASIDNTRSIRIEKKPEFGEPMKRSLPSILKKNTRGALEEERKSAHTKAHSSAGLMQTNADEPDAQPKATKKVRFQPPTAAGRGTEATTLQIYPSETFKMIFNCTTALIADVDEDGQNELVVGTNNRQVLIYRLETAADGKLGLVEVKSWFMYSKVSSLSLSKGAWGRIRLLVGTKFADSYSVIDHTGEITSKSLTDLYGDEPALKNSSGEPLEVRYLERAPVSPKGEVQNPTLTALVSLNGQVAVQLEEGLLWKLDLGQPLFASCALDISGSGLSDTLAIASWNGHTFLIDHNQNCVHFPFEERIQTFIAGQYTVTPGVSKPCLIFVTFYEEVFIYYDIYNTAVKEVLTNLREETQINNVVETKDGQKVDFSEMTMEQLLKLYDSLVDTPQFIPSTTELV